MPYFPTSKADQNPLESEFGVYRGMDGSNVDRNALELCWRISRHIIDKILKDPEVDIDLFKICTPTKSPAIFTVRRRIGL